MRLLICTQVMDQEHPVLGFFHRWSQEFSRHCQTINIICLQLGKHNLPKNTKVHTLGKEQGKRRRLAYAATLFTHAWKLRKEYDVVFVHMNQEYIILLGILWRLLGKRIYMWRNHYSGSFITHIAGFLAHEVYYTSNASYTARFKNSRQMPTGIDTELFSLAKDNDQPVDKLLYVGRISPSKRIEAIIEALALLQSKQVKRRLSVVGPCVADGDEAYLASLRKLAKERAVDVDFVGSVNWDALPHIYRSHSVCINMSPPGMFDKVIGESLSCGTSVITTNADAADAPGVVVIDSNGDLPTLLTGALLVPAQTTAQAKHAYVHGRHSLTAVVRTLVGAWS